MGFLHSSVGKETESESCWVLSDSLRPHGLYSPWNSLGQNTAAGSFSLLQGIFPTQGLNPGLPHHRRILYHLSHREAQLLKNLPAMQETPVGFLGALGSSAREGIGYPLQYSWASPVAQMVKNQPAMREDLRSIPDLGLPTPVFWPGEFHLLYTPWGCKESDTVEPFSLFNSYTLGSYYDFHFTDK